MYKMFDAVLCFAAVCVALAAAAPAKAVGGRSQFVDEDIPLEAQEQVYNPSYRPLPPPRRPLPPLPSPAGYGTSSTFHEQDVQGYGTYNFGYKVDDPYTGNQQGRQEQKDAYGRVTGSYSLVEPDGNIRTVYYVADEYGFRAFVKNSNKPSQSHGLPGPGPY